MFRRFFWLIFTLIFIVHGSSFSQDLTGEDIIREVNDLLNQETAFSRTRMVIETYSGDTRTFEFKSWAKDRGEKTLIRYTEPSRARGQAILMLNNANDIWMYFPRTRRVRKLATHAKRQKMQGSDFSYEDMGSGELFLTDYDADRLDDSEERGEDCYILRLERKTSSDSSYEKLIIKVRKRDFSPLVIEYYEEGIPEVSKILLLEDILLIQDIPTAMRMTMKNERDLTATRLELLNVEYGAELPDEMFTERSLRQ